MTTYLFFPVHAPFDFWMSTTPPTWRQWSSGHLKAMVIVKITHDGQTFIAGREFLDWIRIPETDLA